MNAMSDTPNGRARIVGWNTNIGAVCNHGSLRRKCEICDLSDDLSAAIAKRDEARRERDAARECLREAMKWILDNPYIDGLKKKWRAGAGLEGAK